MGGIAGEHGIGRRQCPLAGAAATEEDSLVGESAHDDRELVDLKSIQYLQMGLNAPLLGPQGYEDSEHSVGYLPDTTLRFTSSHNAEGFSMASRIADPLVRLLQEGDGLATVGVGIVSAVKHAALSQLP